VFYNVSVERRKSVSKGVLKAYRSLKAVWKNAKFLAALTFHKLLYCFVYTTGSKMVLNIKSYCNVKE